MSAPNIYFVDDSEPIGQNQKIQLQITSALSMAQALGTLSVFLHLRTNFDWYQIPQRIGGRELTFAGAIMMAKLIDMASDSSRPWNPNHPYPPPVYWQKFAPSPMLENGANRYRRWHNAGYGPDFDSREMPPWLTYEQEMQWANHQFKTGRPQEYPRIIKPGFTYLFDPTDNTRPPLIVASRYETHEVCKLYTLYLACDQGVRLDTMREDELAREDTARIKLIQESREKFEPRMLSQLHIDGFKGRRLFYKPPITLHHTPSPLKRRRNENNDDPGSTPRDADKKTSVTTTLHEEGDTHREEPDAGDSMDMTDESPKKMSTRRWGKSTNSDRNDPNGDRWGWEKSPGGGPRPTLT